MRDELFPPEQIRKTVGWGGGGVGWGGTHPLGSCKGFLSSCFRADYNQKTTQSPDFFSFFFFFFSGTGDRTQGLVLARQALYHRAKSPTLKPRFLYVDLVYPLNQNQWHPPPLWGLV
ncbi:rCG49358 [Rattus norvegicus]|uniref:RCG49358 n=1 Tax=Rattus norvegicus TaxID=10116 RepID=A6J2G1_RAT|nr:rCG49358 [Rattus norvegicus]